MRFIEDDFNLEDFKQQTINQRKHNLRKKNQPLLRIITFFIIACAFAVALFLYDIINFSIQQILEMYASQSGYTVSCILSLPEVSNATITEHLFLS